MTANISVRSAMPYTRNLHENTPTMFIYRHEDSAKSKLNQNSDKCWKYTNEMLGVFNLKQIPIKNTSESITSTCNYCKFNMNVTCYTLKIQILLTVIITSSGWLMAMWDSSQLNYLIKSHNLPNFLQSYKWMTYNSKTTTS